MDKGSPISDFFSVLLNPTPRFLLSSQSPTAASCPISTDFSDRDSKNKRKPNSEDGIMSGRMSGTPHREMPKTDETQAA